jgi:hypothetical protein
MELAGWIMDVFSAEAWSQQWAVFKSAPYIVLSFVALTAAAVWWFRDKVADARKADATIAGLRERIGVFEQRLNLAAEKVERANEAKNEVKRQFQTFKAEVQSNAERDALAATAAKVDEALQVLSTANAEVRSAVGTSVGVSTATGVGATRPDESQR